MPRFFPYLAAANTATENDRRQPPAMIRIGCSGWSYQHWRGVVYPQSGSRSRWLELDTQEFDTLEINATFYRLPAGRTVEGWGDEYRTIFSSPSRPAAT
jgi:hypothetical protein